MSKVSMFNHITLDGVYSSTNEAAGGMDLFKLDDPAVSEAAHGPGEKSTLLVGLTTYELLKSSWQPVLADPNAPALMKQFAQELTDMRKIVFAESMFETDWENTEIHTSGLADTVKQLKAADGDDIVIMGSGTIIKQLTKEHLIDEYIFVLNPVVAGEGKNLFEGVPRTDLKLLSTKQFDSGLVMLTYVCK